jgi:hypothetical protein
MERARQFTYTLQQGEVAVVVKLLVGRSGGAQSTTGSRRRSDRGEKCVWGWGWCLRKWDKVWPCEKIRLSGGA